MPKARGNEVYPLHSGCKVWKRHFFFAFLKSVDITASQKAMSYHLEAGSQQINGAVK